MKIVIAPDSYKESLSALEVATAIEQGFREIWPDADYLKLPLADGGEGTVEAMVEATVGRIVHVEVTGPLGHRVNAFYGLSGDARSAFIEMAAASGLEQVPPAQRGCNAESGATVTLSCRPDKAVTPPSGEYQPNIFFASRATLSISSSSSRNSGSSSSSWTPLRSCCSISWQRFFIRGTPL